MTEQHAAGRRPLGVTIIGGLVLLGALILAIAGLGGMFFSFVSLIPGSNVAGGALFLWGAAYFVLSIILGISGMGLLRLRTWAWWLAFLVALGSLAWSAYGLYSASTAGVPLEPSTILTVGIVALIFVYLLSVRGRFRRLEAPPVVKTT